MWGRFEQRLCADLILPRHADLNCNAYVGLSATASLLEAEHPLAAALVWPSMISFALQNGRGKRDRHAARQLASCAQSDMAITDYGKFDSHDSHLATLHRDHPRKSAFWDKVTERGCLHRRLLFECFGCAERCVLNFNLRLTKD